MFDAVQMLTWITICANTATDATRPPRPEPLTRPGIIPREQPTFHDRMRRLAAL